MSVSLGIARIDEVPSVPWKNGGGTTRTLASGPAGASMEDFRWRLSLAEITTPGSFSSFPGVDRIILLWSGDGVVLHSPSWGEHTLSEPWHPYPFRGEDDVTCTLLGGATTDLNLMLRRGAASGNITVHRAAARFASSFEAVVLLCVRGVLNVRTADGAVLQLAAGEFFQASGECLVADLAEPGSVFLAASMTNQS